MTRSLKSLRPALLAGLCLFAGYTAQDEEQDALAARVETLEEELGRVQEYLQAQAKAAGAFEKSLATVEAGGFTYGINGDSRKELLAALRADLKSRAKSVPGSPAPAPEEPAPRGRRR